VKVAIPPMGFGERLNRMHDWLDDNAGADGWEITPAGVRGVINDAIAVYFRDAALAAAFAARWCAPRHQAQPRATCVSETTSPPSASPCGRTRRRSAMLEPTRIDPTLPIARSSTVAAVEHLKYQLTGLADGQHTLHRLIDIAKERVETAWDGLTPQDIGALDSWLNSRAGVAKGEARLRWGFIRGVFDTVREERGAADAKLRRTPC
jgi:hypothetical protein